MYNLSFTFDRGPLLEWPPDPYRACWWAELDTRWSGCWRGAAAPDSESSWSSERRFLLWEAGQSRWRRAGRCCFCSARWALWRRSWSTSQIWSRLTPLEKREEISSEGSVWFPDAPQKNSQLNVRFYFNI